MTENLDMLIEQCQNAWGWTMFILSWMDTIGRGGLYAAMKWAGILSSVYAWFLPRYTAVAFHDGEAWITDIRYWQKIASKPLADVVLSELGKVSGKRVDDNDARIPRAPRARFYQIKLVGRHRGVYRVVGVRLYNEAILNRFGRCRRPNIQHEQQDEMLPL